MNSRLNSQIVALQARTFGPGVSNEEIKSVLWDLMDLLLTVNQDDEVAKDDYPDQLKKELNHATKLNTAYHHDLERHREWLAEMNKKDNKSQKKIADYETVLERISSANRFNQDAQFMAKTVLKRWSKK